MSTAASSVPVKSSVDRKTAWKILATVAVAIIGLGSLFYASAGDAVQLYKMVDEVMVAPTQFQGKRLDVHGYVVKGSIEQKPGTLEYRFKLETKAPRAHQVIDVSYRGLVPDTFKSDAEAVVTGVLTTDNQLKGEKIAAKCPSKYEAQQGVSGGNLQGGYERK